MHFRFNLTEIYACGQGLELFTSFGVMWTRPQILSLTLTSLVAIDMPSKAYETQFIHLYNRDSMTYLTGCCEN